METAWSFLCFFLSFWKNQLQDMSYKLQYFFNVSVYKQNNIRFLSILGGGAYISKLLLHKPKQKKYVYKANKLQTPLVPSLQMLIFCLRQKQQKTTKTTTTAITTNNISCYNYHFTFILFCLGFSFTVLFTRS